jgi:hypothetical protein
MDENDEKLDVTKPRYCDEHVTWCRTRRRDGLGEVRYCIVVVLLQAPAPPFGLLLLAMLGSHRGEGRESRAAEDDAVGKRRGGREAERRATGRGRTGR